MKNSKSVTRRMLTALLCLSLLCGMVVGTIGAPVVAATQNVEKFSVDFADMLALVPAAKYGAYATCQITAEDTEVNAWVNQYFDLYHNRECRAYKKLDYFSEDSNTIESDWISMQMRPNKNGWVALWAGGTGGEMLRKGFAFTLKDGDAYAKLKNFEATLTFNMAGSTALGSVYIAFHEETPGRFAWQTYNNFDAVIIGNGTGTYAAGGDDGITIKKRGEGCSNNAMEAFFKDSTDAEDTLKDLDANTDYQLKVKVVGTRVEVTVQDVAGTVVYNTVEENGVSALAGTISFGITNQSRGFKKIEVTELDEEGNPVDFGITTAATKSFNFADLANVITNDPDVAWGAYGLYLSSDGTTDADEWMAERFTMYSNREGHTFSAREYMGQTGNVENKHYLTPHNSGYMRIRNVGDGMLRTIETMAVKGAYLRNFEAELTFKYENLERVVGGVVVSFHETGVPGFIDYNSANHGSTDMVFVGSGVDGITNPGSNTWRFGYRIKKAGVALSDYNTDANSSRYPDKDVAGLTNGVDYTLYIKVVNGDLTLSIRNVSTGAFLTEKTVYEDAVSDKAGSISFGIANTEHFIKKFTVTELDANGKPVAYGTLAGTPSVDYYEANFTDLAGMLMKNTGQLAGGYGTGKPAADTAYKPTADNDANNANINAWMAEKFASMYTNREGHTFAPRPYLGSQDHYADPYHTIGFFEIIHEGYLRYYSGGDGMLRTINTMTIAGDNGAAQLKNFEANLRFRLGNVGDGKVGGVMLSFHETGVAGKVDWNGGAVDNPDFVLIGSGAKSIEDSTNYLTGVRVKKAGANLEDSLTVAASTKYPDIPVTLEAGVEYNLYVKVVNGDLTVGVTNVATGAVVMAETPYEDAVSDVAGTFSVGAAANGGFEYLKSVRVVQLDNSGAPVAFGTAIEEPEQADNTAVIDGDVINVKAGEGYELKAGSLIVTDSEGNKFVPERVGYRNGGNAAQYNIPEEAVGECTVAYEFIQPGEEDGYNVGFLGTSVHENEEQDSGNLRFVYRLNIDKDGKVLYNGQKVAVKEYGLLLASSAILADAKDLDIETAADSMHVHRFAWPTSGRYYDKCDEYADIAVQVNNIPTAAASMNLHSRVYLILENNEVVYMDAVTANYANAK